MKKSIFSISSIGLLAVIFLCVNGLSNAVLGRFSFDLSQEGLYSLSDGTKKIVRELKEPVVIRYYFSRLESVRDAGVQLYATRVRDLLHEYARVSRGMITLEEYDPQPDSEEEEWAQKYGLQPIPLPSGEKLYFGMVTSNASGDEEVIPLFNLNRQETLEYDITSSMYKITRETRPKIAILTPLKIDGSGQDLPPQYAQQAQPAWIIATQLEALGEIQYLEPNVESIADDIDALVVLHPKNLSEQTRYAIDQHLMRGGTMLLAVDPYCAADSAGIDQNNPMAFMTADRSSELNSLTKSWGVTLKEKSVLGDPDLATNVSAGRGQAPESFLVWLSYGPGLVDDSGKPLVNPDQVVTSEVGNLMFPWAGALDITEVEGVEVEPLIKTSPRAMLYPENELRMAAQNPTELRKKYRSGGDVQVLAARIHGTLTSSFPGKPGGEGTAAMSEPGGHIPKGVKPATVIMLADVDFLADDYSASVQEVMGYRLVSLLNENLVFVQNAVEQLSGSDDLIALRSRGSFLRPFTKVRDIEARAESRWRSEEMRLQEERNAASSRLTELQNASGQGGQAVFSQALLDEMRMLRERRQQAEQRLREVRWQLRRDKEALGSWLFVLNTFAVPSILIFAAVYLNWRAGSSRRARQRAKA
jgi:ABC-type uncharacterized transport system involved in gliding motility auxiliary subunit